MHSTGIHPQVFGYMRFDKTLKIIPTHFETVKIGLELILFNVGQDRISKLKNILKHFSTLHVNQGKGI